MVIMAGSQNIIPMLAYENGVKALEWLVEVFGFTEKEKFVGEDGTLHHGEIELDGGTVMLATPTPDYESPKTHSQHCEKMKLWTQVPWVIDGVLVYVEDLQSHFDHVKASGAKILSEIETNEPGARYRVEDLEGHRWFFFQK